MRRTASLAWILIAGMTVSAAETEDVVFFGRSRPILLRLRVEIDGKPFDQVWEDYTAELFDSADRNQSKMLEEDEVNNVPTPQMMSQLFRGFSSFYTADRNELSAMDGDDDGKVDLKELRAFYAAKGGSRVLVLPPGNGNQLGTALTKELFARLDTNKDGSLSREELGRASELMTQLDENEDEILVTSELVGPVARFSPPVPIGNPGGGMMARPGDPGANAMTSLFYPVPKEKGSNRLAARLEFAQQLVNRYDANQSNGLTRSEIGLDAPQFKTLDRNGNGVLDAVELLRWIVLQPDAEMTIRLGERQANAKAIEIQPRKNPSPIEKNARTEDSGTQLTLLLKGIELELKTSDLGIPVGLAGYFERNFNLADKERKGYIPLSTWADNRNPYLKNMASLANRNNDDKLTREEINAFMELQNKVSRCALAFRAQEYGRGLWEIMDINGDGQLSGRELKHAVKHLLAYDINEDGEVEDEEIPYQYQVVMTPSHNTTLTTSRPGGSAAVTVSREGPDWFQKMDRNGDGDVSSREFFGDPALFSKLDLDQDGYLSLVEARTIEEQYRTKN